MPTRTPVLIVVALLLAGAAGLASAESAAAPPAQEKEKANVPPALDYRMKSLAGKEVDLAQQYRGKVVLMVNVASQCGLTPQYEQLQKLHEKYQAKGLAIAGFPANNFGAQEPGSDQDIQQFCESNYGVKFDMFSKISVKGDDKHPLYEYLTEKDPVGKKEGDITWNFEKFLLDRQGQVIARFSPRTRPDDPEVVKAIEAELARQ